MIINNSLFTNVANNVATTQPTTIAHSKPDLSSPVRRESHKISRKYCRDKVRNDQEAAKQNERHAKYKAFLEKARQQLYDNALTPIVEHIKSLSSIELDDFIMQQSVKWEIEPHFMNLSSGHEVTITMPERPVRFVDPSELQKRNLSFIERCSGQKFTSFEDAQAFMLEDAKTRPHSPKDRETGVLLKSKIDGEDDEIKRSLTIHGELDRIFNKIQSAEHEEPKPAGSMCPVCTNLDLDLNSDGNLECSCCGKFERGLLKPLVFHKTNETLADWKIEIKPIEQREIQPMTSQQKEDIIAEALKTDEGRMALVAAMEPLSYRDTKRQDFKGAPNPVKTHELGWVGPGRLELATVGRKEIKLDELPTEALARYVIRKNN